MSRGGGRAAALSLPAQRAVLLGAMAVTTAASWIYVAGPGTRMMVGSHDGILVAVPVWAAMMTGMMLPGAAPMFAAYVRVNERNGGEWRPVAAFVLAYLSLWIAMSAVGACVQQWLARAGLVSHMGASTRPLVSAALLVLAGAYQFSPLKQACLRRCRTPLGFLMTEWRSGVSGALKLGYLHGAECVVCCWALMALMFVLGTMNLLWMAALALLMLAEKAAPAGPRIGRWSGAVFVVWGLVLAVTG
jgi:predicted metal-binding membrane protein